MSTLAASLHQAAIAADRHAADLERVYHESLFQSERATPVALPRPLPFLTSEPAPVRVAPCHAGIRAGRLAASLADLRAHPSVFRCPTCSRLLDAPLGKGARNGE